MNLRKIYKSNDGVVGIVVAVLLLGLFVSIVSIIKLYYVPAWMEEREAEHIEQVLTQFSGLKFAIDTQSANNQSDTPIATSITLGSKELPFLMSMRAFGALEIIDTDFSIAITDESGNVSGPFNLGIIKYTSANAYYIPDEKQSFVYEAGAILTSQTSGDSITIKPSFKQVLDSNFRIIFNIVNISGIGGKVSWGGYDTIPIQTEYNNSVNYSVYETEYINIKTSYSNAWKLFFDASLKNAGLYNNIDYEIINVADGEFSIKFLTNNYPYPKVDIKVIEILAQIGPGWIE